MESVTTIDRAVNSLPEQEMEQIRLVQDQITRGRWSQPGPVAGGRDGGGMALFSKSLGSNQSQSPANNSLVHPVFTK